MHLYNMDHHGDGSSSPLASGLVRIHFKINLITFKAHQQLFGTFSKPEMFLMVCAPPGPPV